MAESSVRLLADHDVERHDGNESTPHDAHARRDRQKSPWSRVYWICQAIFLSGNVVMFFHSTMNATPMGLRRPFEVIDAPTIAKRSTWDLTLGESSKFTAMDPDVADAAWADISLDSSQGWVKISKEELDGLGKLSKSSVQAADGSGYLALVELFHQIHCLDYLRKTNIMYTHLYPNAMHHASVPAEYHIPHCIDSIRMALQCNAELTVVTQNWVDGWIEPWADWRTEHQCRDFDAIRDWARKNKANTKETFVHPELGVVLHENLNVSALPIGRKVRFVDGL